MIEKQTVSNFNKVVAVKNISAGTIIFTAEDWRADEILGWKTLTVDKINEMPETERNKFLIYSYDLEFGKTVGTVDHGLATDLSNFVNHSCEPNLGFDLHENVVAKKEIKYGSDLTIDYGTFVVNFDQDFECSCGDKCRGKILKDDWKLLHRSRTVIFPKFIQAKIEELKLP
jgi:hypothetical protein